MYETEYRKKFVFAGITYEHRLIDDMVAQVCEGGGGGLEGRSTGSLMTWWHRCVKGGGGGRAGVCVWGVGGAEGPVCVGGGLEGRWGLVEDAQDCTHTEYSGLHSY